MDYGEALGGLSDMLRPSNIEMLAAVYAARLMDTPKRKKTSVDKNKQKKKRKIAEATRKRNRRK